LQGKGEREGRERERREIKREKAKGLWTLIRLGIKHKHPSLLGVVIKRSLARVHHAERAARKRESKSERASERERHTESKSTRERASERER
jgi:hypothetical protein